MKQYSFTDRILLQFLPRISNLLLKALAFTIRRTVLHPEHPRAIWDQGRYVIVAFWHQHLLMMPFLPHRGRVGMMISRHRDGEFIARAVRRFGIDSVRGSTTQGGSGALRQMVRFFETGANLAITPDGPQGPKHIAQMGAVELARLTSAPILPVAYGASRKKTLNSWDSFIVPFPFSRVCYVWGEPIFVPRNAGKKELEEKRLLLERRLSRITGEADGLFSKGPPSP